MVNKDSHKDYRTNLCDQSDQCDDVNEYVCVLNKKQTTISDQSKNILKNEYNLTN